MNAILKPEFNPQNLWWNEITTKGCLLIHTHLCLRVHTHTHTPYIDTLMIKKTLENYKLADGPCGPGTERLEGRRQTTDVMDLYGGVAYVKLLMLHTSRPHEQQCEMHFHRWKRRSLCLQHSPLSTGAWPFICTQPMWHGFLHSCHIGNRRGLAGSSDIKCWPGLGSGESSSIPLGQVLVPN